MSVPSLKRRLLSMTYEAMLLFAVVFIAGWLFDTLTVSRHALMFRHARQAWLFVVLGIYFVWFWTHGGQTLAMKTWRIRVTEADGRALRIGRAFVRYLLLWIVVLPLLGIAWLAGAPPWVEACTLAIALIVPPFYALIDRDGQFLHDRMLGTRLIAVEK